MRAFLHQYRKAVAFLMLALACFVAITLSTEHTAHVAAKDAAVVLHKSDLKACARGNILRRAVNARTEQSAATRVVLVNFIKSAEVARREAYKRSHARTDLFAAQAYAREEQEESKIHFTKVPLVNCAKAYPSP